MCAAGLSCNTSLTACGCAGLETSSDDEDYQPNGAAADEDMDEGAEQPDQDVEAPDAQEGETYLLRHVMHGDVQHSCSRLSMAQGVSQITLSPHAIRCNSLQGVLRLLTMLGVEEAAGQIKGHERKSTVQMIGLEQCARHPYYDRLFCRA